ncbi:hypothetical protein GGG16DRAFT_104787 [Schizophyllum commune]
MPGSLPRHRGSCTHRARSAPSSLFQSRAVGIRRLSASALCSQFSNSSPSACMLDPGTVQKPSEYVRNIIYEVLGAPFHCLRSPPSLSTVTSTQNRARLAISSSQHVAVLSRGRRQLFPTSGRAARFRMRGRLFSLRDRR